MLNTYEHYSCTRRFSHLAEMRKLRRDTAKKIAPIKRAMGKRLFARVIEGLRAEANPPKYRLRELVRAGAIRPSMTKREADELTERLADIHASVRRYKWTPTQLPIDERHAKRVEAIVCRGIAESDHRSDASGELTRRVTLTHEPREVGHTTVVTDNRTVYRGNFKGWAAKDVEHQIVVPYRYLTRVYRRGLTVVDGMLTLDAQPCDIPRQLRDLSLELYAATWSRPSRGFAIYAHRGFIARLKHDDSGRITTFHAATPEGALRGVLRKHAIAEAQYEMSDVTMEKAAKDPRKSKWIVRLRGSTPFSRTLSRSLILGQRSVYVEA